MALLLWSGLVQAIVGYSLSPEKLLIGIKRSPMSIERYPAGLNEILACGKRAQDIERCLPTPDYFFKYGFRYEFRYLRSMLTKMVLNWWIIGWL